MSKSVQQIDIFGGVSSAAAGIPDPEFLPKPINGHAMSLLILLQNRNKWVDIIYVCKKYLYPKFQTRIGEIVRTYPALVEKRRKVVVTRFGNKTDITEYKIKDYNDGARLYIDTINKAGSMAKTIKGEAVSC